MTLRTLASVCLIIVAVAANVGAVNVGNAQQKEPTKEERAAADQIFTKSTQCTVIFTIVQQCALIYHNEPLAKAYGRAIDQLVPLQVLSGKLLGLSIEAMVSRAKMVGKDIHTSCLNASTLLRQYEDQCSTLQMMNRQLQVK